LNSCKTDFNLASTISSFAINEVCKLWSLSYFATLNADDSFRFSILFSSIKFILVSALAFFISALVAATFAEAISANHLYLSISIKAKICPSLTLSPTSTNTFSILPITAAGTSASFNETIRPITGIV
jgi:hypothetical protein